MLGVGRRAISDAQRGVGLRRLVAVARRLVDRRHGAPEAVARLVAPRDDQRVRRVRVGAGEQPGVVGERAALAVRDGAEDARDRRGPVGQAPVLGARGLVGRADLAPRRSDGLDLLEVGGVGARPRPCGGRPRNRSGSRSTNGRTSFNQANGSLLTPLVGRHWPGSVPTVKRNGPNRPSPARAASSPAAAASPVAIPPAFARPPAIASSAVWYAVSIGGQALGGDAEAAVDAAPRVRRSQPRRPASTSGPPRARRRTARGRRRSRSPRRRRRRGPSPGARSRARPGRRRVASPFPVPGGQRRRSGPSP